MILFAMCGPYMSLVSMWLTPASMAARGKLSAASTSLGGANTVGPASCIVVRAIMISPMNKFMRIGELAELGKVTPRTVRYYESLRLIPPGEREGAGQHRYPEQTVARLQEIDQLKALGLSLEEIGKVIHLYFNDPTGKRAKLKVLECFAAISLRRTYKCFRSLSFAPS